MRSKGTQSTTSTTITTPDVLLARAPEVTVFPRGDYNLLLTAVEQTERNVYGTERKEMAVKFTFTGQVLTDGTWRTQYVNFPAGAKEVTFSITTGLNMASQRSNGRQIIENIVDRELTKDEIRRLNLLKLPTLPDVLVSVMVLEKQTEDGDVRNQLVIDSISRIPEGVLDITPCLVSPPDA